MLVLSRKSGETIQIDGKISVEVLRIKGNRVQIGIRAPDDVRILRGELPSMQEVLGNSLLHFVSCPDSNSGPEVELIVAGPHLTGVDLH